MDFLTKQLQLLLILGLTLALSACTPAASHVLYGEESSAVEQFRSIENKVPDLQSKKAKILFLGDMMLGRHVRTLMNREGLDYPFNKLPEDFFQGYAMVIANLEGPITERFVTGGTSMIFGFPPDTAEILKKHGITTVTLGNNHTLNRGAEGFAETEKYLQEQGIEFFGEQDGESWEESVLSKEINGLKLTFISLHDAERDIDQNTALEIIKKADPISDYVFVLPHWGVEYQHQANDRQKTLAHEWIDNGADIVIGHHPHVVQNMEVYNEKPIFYSLGNFIFDQYFSAETQEELAIKLEIKRDELKFALIPMKSARSQSYLMDEAQKSDFLKKFLQWSSWDENSEMGASLLQGELSF